MTPLVRTSEYCARPRRPGRMLHMRSLTWPFCARYELHNTKPTHRSLFLSSQRLIPLPPSSYVTRAWWTTSTGNEADLQLKLVAAAVWRNTSQPLPSLVGCLPQSGGFTRATSTSPRNSPHPLLHPTFPQRAEWADRVLIQQTSIEHESPLTASPSEH